MVTKATNTGLISQHAAAIDTLIALARTQDSVRRTLEYGTPADKKALLAEVGLSFEVLDQLHGELEEIIYWGSLPWWFW